MQNLAIEALLREAKRLHRAAISESLAVALPILRRLILSQALQKISLTELTRQREIIQRKHILKMLAFEAGFSSWEHYRPILENQSPEQLQHFDLLRKQSGNLNIWFSTFQEATLFASQNGGQVLKMGTQAVVFQNS